MTRDKMIHGTSVHPSRRALLAAALATPALIRPFGGASAEESKKIVIGTWGGDYANLLHKNIEMPFLEPKGWEVVQDTASDAPRRAKMVAEKRLPRGTSDVQALSDVNVAEMVAAGVLEKIDYSKLSRGPNVLPVLKSDYAVPHIYSGLVLVYNPKVFPTPPASLNDLFDAKNAGKVGVIDIQYIYTIMAAAIAGGGSLTNFEPAKGKLLDLKKQGVKIYPTNEGMAQGLKTEEVGLCIMWKARCVQWQKAGISVESAAPKEGVLAFQSLFSIPKNAPNKQGSYAYLDAVLQSQAQIAFANDMAYNPTVNDAPLPDDLRKRIGFTDDEQKRLMTPDYAYVTQHDAEWKEWWDKEFKG
ncbi:putative spermidine/putrescine transport system substrate-binding protein [Rhizobiales bacterium GAS191]|nr:putative spermidine/putrescine transport system substrate-binding protein [Rhizobiales bacterium GAS191]